MTFETNRGTVDTMMGPNGLGYEKGRKVLIKYGASQEILDYLEEIRRSRLTKAERAEEDLAAMQENLRQWQVTLEAVLGPQGMGDSLRAKYETAKRVLKERKAPATLTGWLASRFQDLLAAERGEATEGFDMAIAA